MAKVKSLGGTITLPECTLSFQLTFDKSDLPEESYKIGIIIDQISNLSPELKEILSEFVELLERKAKQWRQNQNT